MWKKYQFFRLKVTYQNTKRIIGRYPKPANLGSGRYNLPLHPSDQSNVQNSSPLVYNKNFRFFAYRSNHLILDLHVRCLEKSSKQYSPKWWCVRCWCTLVKSKTSPSKNPNYQSISWVWPLPRMPVTTRTITFLVGNPGICHCYWVGGRSKVYPSSPQKHKKIRIPFSEGEPGSQRFCNTQQSKSTLVHVII